MNLILKLYILNSRSLINIQNVNAEFFIKILYTLYLLLGQIAAIQISKRSRFE